MKTVEQLTETLENLSDSELVNLWNDYQSDISGESQVYDFDDEFFKTFFSSPSEAARAVYFGKIDGWNNKYIQFNGYGNLESSNYLTDLISVYDLANYIIDHEDEFADLLENDEDEEIAS